MSIKISEATGSDTGELTAIAFAAKRHWGYPEEWIDLWRDELTVDAEYVEANSVLVAKDGSRILGWCSVSESGDGCSLDACWVLPEAAGRGIGSRLVGRALELATDRGHGTLTVIADPNAEGFYVKSGFRRVGEQPSKPQGRRLPVLEARLS